MVAIATLEEFASAIQQDVDTATSQLLLLDLAQGLITEVIGEHDPWPVTAKAIALAAAARAYTNPTGAKSTTNTAGPFTKTEVREAGAMGVFLTDAELDRLNKWFSRGSKRIGTIRLGSGYPAMPRHRHRNY